MKNIKRIIAIILSFILLLSAVSTLSGCSWVMLTSEKQALVPGKDAGIVKGPDSAAKVELKDIPPYSGETFTVINDNIPSFSKAELTTVAYERYSPLDRFGRCGAAIASCGKELMPTGERGNISSIYPSGWEQEKYPFVDGQSLYNRSHLIGWQLSGEDANERNLITGTRYMNAEGMLPFENMIADYIKETDNHVAYRVTPLYDGKNLVCSGVQMEAYSIEDDGDGICFNVFCYNVQPGVVIDYATGENHLDESWEGTSGITGTFIINRNSKKIHREDCEAVKSISEKNRQEYTGDIDILLKSGFKKCGECFD